jgi:hypothetical protein
MEKSIIDQTQIINCSVYGILGSPVIIGSCIVKGANIAPSSSSKICEESNWLSDFM